MLVFKDFYMCMEFYPRSIIAKRTCKMGIGPIESIQNTKH